MYYAMKCAKCSVNFVDSENKIHRTSLSLQALHNVKAATATAAKNNKNEEIRDDFLFHFRLDATQMESSIV